MQLTVRFPLLMYTVRTVYILYSLHSTVCILMFTVEDLQGQWRIQDFDPRGAESSLKREARNRSPKIFLRCAPP